MAATDTTTAVLSGGSLACVAGALGTLVRTHTLPTGYTPVRDAVSEYGVGAYGRWYRAMVIALGAGALLLAAALGHGTGIGAAGIAWLVVYGASRIAIAGFMTDPGGAATTTAGRVHLLLAAIAFTSIPFAATNVTQDVHHDADWSGVYGTLHALAIAVAVTAVATLAAAVVPALRGSVFGLVERALYAASFAWLLLCAGHLLSLSSSA